MVKRCTSGSTRSTHDLGRGGSCGIIAADAAGSPPSAAII